MARLVTKSEQTRTPVSGASVWHLQPRPLHEAPVRKKCFIRQTAGVRGHTGVQQSTESQVTGVYSQSVFVHTSTS